METTSTTRQMLWASTIGYAMDGFDMLILTFMLSAITSDLGLTVAEAGSLATGTLLGAFLGGLLFGRLSDYYGRIPLLTWSIIVFAVFTAACATANGYWDLLLYRTIAGLGLGGEFGIGMALAAESCAQFPARRARVHAQVALGWQCGVLLAALVTPLLLPSIGWRGMFTIGIIPALIAGVMRYRLHDPAFTTQQLQKKVGFWTACFGSVEKRAATVGIGILCAIQNFGYFGLMIWLPNYLSKQFGLSLLKSSMWTAVTIFGMMIGIITFGYLADRIGRKPSFICFQIGACITVLCYAQIQDPALLLWCGWILGFFVNGMLGGYGSLISEIYPTNVRATAQNVLFNFGRIFGGIGAVLIPWISSSYTFFMAVILLAALYIIDVVVTLWLIPECQGKPLPE